MPKSNKTERSGEYPKYLLKINGELKFLSFQSAYVAFDSGMAHIEIGSVVLLDEKLNVREMTDKDRAEISDAADEYSASK